MKSLRSQLTLYIMTIVLVMVVLVSLLANMAVNKQFKEYIIRQEQIRRDEIVEDLEKLYNGMTKNWSAEYLHAIGMYSLYDGYLLSIYDGGGELIWDAESHDMTLCQQIMGDITDRMDRRKENSGFSTHTYDLLQGKQKIGSVSIQTYGPYFLQESEFQFINTLNGILLLIGLVSCVASVITGGFFAYKIARPVTKTAEIAKEISNGEYNIRFEGDTKTKELNMLISSINNMSGALSRQEQYRKQLTADIAHELRTPLAALRAHLEAMAEGIWDASPERLNGCVEEVKRLSTLIVDLDRLAKLEQENLKLQIAEVDLLETVDTVVHNFEREADKKNIKLDIQGETTIVQADRERILQVITNLLSNGIKYTPNGGSLKIQIKAEKGKGILVFEDTGIGIAPKDLPYVFERFYRTDQSRNRKSGGAGIGLTIAKSIVEAHHGEISVESIEGAGSCFKVVLPMEYVEAL